ncbi:MAG: spondin domain-containing protein [Nitrosomonadales bacterium]|nr:spondin domain-containing protein [Nitrosomonadales bacterium]
MNRINVIPNKTATAALKQLAKHRLTNTLLVAAIFAVAPIAAHAATLSVSVTNLTRGINFTPLLVAAHPAASALFTEGQAASADLQAMAEGGNITPLQTALTAAGATTGNPAAGLLAPGASTASAATFSGGAGTANVALSVVAMMLPTNDGFIGLNAITIPTTPGTYTYYVNAYDAGTEANNEIVGGGAPGTPGFPVPAPIGSGTGGTGIPGAVAEGYVHIHRGVLGDTNPTGGLSDIDSTVHRWLNPVARVVLTVQ